MVTKALPAFLLVFIASAALSQTPVEKPEWTEEAAPQPPVFSKDKLVPIQMPPYVTLEVGIDPETVTVGADGVVRYVVVMRNASGSANAAFEGILCATGDVKTYARLGSAGTWLQVPEPQWRSMTDNLPSRHAFAFSKQGACNGRSAPKVGDIVRVLKQGAKSYD